MMDRSKPRARWKSSKNFFIFKLTTRSYVFRLLASPRAFTSDRANLRRLGSSSTMNIASRQVSAPRGPALSCKGWPQEAAMRMLMNNLDPEVAERPEDLVVYGGSGRAARSWTAFEAIVETLRQLEHDETLVVQSGKP